MELHENGCSSREARPSLWIFSGSNTGWLVIGVLFFVSLAMLLSRLGLEWYLILPLSLIPLALITLFVMYFVNDRAPSHALDLVAFKLWQLRSKLFLHGLLERPPELWVRGRKPRHPERF
jgi:energy-coupling factor transporter transmembrane protein EcfT